MLVKERGRREIESKLQTMGDYVKIDYLSSCLKNHIDSDTKRYVLIKLRDLFIQKSMFPDAGRAMTSAGEINASSSGKISDFLKAVEYFVKGGDFEGVQKALSRALSSAQEFEKKGIKEKIKSMYIAQARELTNKNKRRQAIGFYEALFEFDLDAREKEEVDSNLLALYKSMGRIEDYFILKRKINK